MVDSSEPKKISEEEYARWLTPLQAMTKVGNASGDWNTAPRAILRRADSGKIRVHAEDIEWTRGSKAGKLEKFSPVPPYVLRGWHESNHQAYLDFWKDGDAEAETRTGHSAMDAPIKWRLFGVRFNPEDIDKLIGPSVKPKPAPAPSAPAVPPEFPVPDVSALVRLGPVKSRAGRLPKDFWEDMIIAAMTAMFFDATLQPRSAAEVQRWMEGWLSENIAENEHPGETAIKERAAKVFTAWRESRK